MLNFTTILYNTFMKIKNFIWKKSFNFNIQLKIQATINYYKYFQNHNQLKSVHGNTQQEFLTLIELTEPNLSVKYRV